MKKVAKLATKTDVTVYSYILIIIIIIIIIINNNVCGAILMTMVTARVHPVHLMTAD